MSAILQKAEAGAVQLREREHAAEELSEQQLHAGEVAQGGQGGAPGGQGGQGGELRAASLHFIACF